ncbi:MAG: hypothetical protein HeimC2_02620 [Candidatus Heimdallarchaeota archaeon LC_2]|nr:MAG: hypothetical protein HeimC2_02620 [Candidatus Heimdallarchaeota archaeon LC_2]
MEDIQKIDDLMDAGNYENVLSIINEYLKQDLSLTEMHNLNVKKSFVLNCLGQYDQTIEISENLLNQQNVKEDKLLKIDVLNEAIYANYRLNQLTNAQELIEIAKNLVLESEQNDTVKRRSSLLVNQIYTLTAKSNLEQAYLLATENYHLCEKIKDQSYLARAYSCLAWVLSPMGNLDFAIEESLKGLKIREKLPNQFSLAYSLFQLGVLNRDKGEIDKAYEYLERSRVIREKIGNQQDISWNLMFLGDILLEKGDAQGGQQFYEQALLITKQIDYKFGSIFSLNRLSGIYNKRGNTESAIQTLEKSLEIAKTVEDNDPEIMTLFHIIYYICSKDIHHSKLEEYLNRMNTIRLKYQNRPYDQVYNLARAIKLKKSIKTQELRKARALFKEIIDGNVIDYNFTRIAMTNYAEILADELKGYLGEFGVSDKLANLSSEEASLQFQTSFSIIADNYLNRTRNALVESNLNEAKKLINHAQYINDFLELHKKGNTPFRILLALFMKERSLSELSEILKITKGGLNIPLKLLRDLDFIKISKEEKIRSATMLKKFYSLSQQGKELMQPFTMKILNNFKPEMDISNDFDQNLMLPRMFIKLNRDIIGYFTLYQNFVENQIMLNPFKTNVSSKLLSKQELNSVAKIFDEQDELTINHVFLTDNQYNKYQKLYKEFQEKIQKELLSDFDDVTNGTEKEKTKCITNITLPIKKLMDLESYLKYRERKTKSKNKEKVANTD